MAAGRYISALVKCAVCLPAPLIYMETIIFETNRAVSAVQSVIVVSNEKEMERAMRDQRFYHLSIAQERQLFYSKLVLGLLEITFASGWRREHEFISGHGEIFVPRNVCACVHAE